MGQAASFQLLMQSRGFNPRGLAKASKVNSTTIYAAMHGDDIRVQTARKLAQALNVGVDDIYRGIKKEPHRGQPERLRFNGIANATTEQTVTTLYNANHGTERG